MMGIRLAGLLLLLILISPGGASAAQLQLDWRDRSFNESGFLILRQIVRVGPMSPIATVGQNITTYTDTGLSPGTKYCYRVLAFNVAGNSKLSKKACRKAH